MKLRIAAITVSSRHSTWQTVHRCILAVCISSLLTTAATAEIMGRQQQAIDFTAPAEAAKQSTWPNSKQLGCTKDGFGWGGDKRTSIDGWIETKPLAIGTGWRPPQSAEVRIKIQTNYPAIVSTSHHSKIFYTPGIYVRYSADRVHWSDWQPTKLSEDPRESGSALYTASIGVARRTSHAYRTKLQQWSRRDDIVWASDEDEFCRWLVKKEPDFFAKQRPFVGYVQFLIEDSFKGSQRLTRFEADVSWGVSGMQTIAQSPVATKRQNSSGAWDFRGVKAPPSAKDE